MKRMLNERAREESSSTTTPTPTSSSNKAPKLEESIHTINEDSAFYLKHQNKALAAELKQLQFNNAALLKEQQQRRLYIQQANDALVQLRQYWNQLQQQLGKSTTTATVTLPPIHHGISTGSHDSVEMTVALHQQLALFANGTDPSDTQRYQQQLAEATTTNSSNNNMDDPLLAVTQLQGQITNLKAQIQELAQSRDHMAERERKLRRNIYRLDAGLWNAHQVVSFLETADEDDSDLKAELQLLKAQQSNNNNNNNNNNNASNNNNDDQKHKIDAEQLTQAQHELSILKTQMQQRDELIQELSQKVATSETIVTELTCKQLTAHDEESLQQLEATKIQLYAAETKISRLEAKVQQVKENWAQSMGNEQELQQALQNLQEQYHSTETEPIVEVELKHKLSQAIEQVRQAETIKQSLNEALQTNKLLKERVEMLKNDNASLQEEIKKINEPREEESAAAIAEKAGVTFEELTEKQFDRLYRDNRKMKKDLATLTKSKNEARTRVERLEKERDNIMDSNARLLQQSTEKDEVNAKSLSTVLHLKNLLETAKQEKEKLEEQVQAANELAEAAREANLAKEAVSEEFLKEKQVLEDRLQELEEELQGTQQKLHDSTVQMAESSGQTSVFEDRVKKVQDRCDALIDELQSKNEEVRQLRDNLTRTTAEFNKVNAELAEIKEQGAGSVKEQNLQTQVDHLKFRLRCTICKYRDKACILATCKHMHCRECIDIRIKDRSRKCPSCNTRFSESDVDAIFL